MHKIKNAQGVYWTKLSTLLERVNGSQQSRIEKLSLLIFTILTLLTRNGFNFGGRIKEA